MTDGAVLVCGLGALGQACLQRLVRFHVPIRCLDQQLPNWRDPELEAELARQLTLGDMRRPHVLEQAGVVSARAVLLLSSDSTVNIEAALQARLLNPQAEIVVRSSSSQADLGALLEERLPGVAVVDPVLLCAGAIASALRRNRFRPASKPMGKTSRSRSSAGWTGGCNDPCGPHSPGPATSQCWCHPAPSSPPPGATTNLPGGTDGDGCD